MTTIYDKLETLGYFVRNAPRSNPRDHLNEPYVLYSTDRFGANKIVLRGETRDDLEAKLHGFYKRHAKRHPCPSVDDETTLVLDAVEVEYVKEALVRYSNACKARAACSTQPGGAEQDVEASYVAQSILKRLS